MQNVHRMSMGGMTCTFITDDEINEQYFHPYRHARDCFVYNEEFQQKRFNRYITKAKEDFFKYLQSIDYNPNVHTFEEKLKEMFATYFYNLMYQGVKEGRIDIKSLSEDVARIVNNNGKTYNPKESFMVFIKPRLEDTTYETKVALNAAVNYVLLSDMPQFFQLEEGDHSFYTIVQYATKNACLRFLRNQYLKGNYTEDKMMSNFLPQTALEKFIILEDIFTTVYEDLNMKFLSNPYADKENVESFEELWTNDVRVQAEEIEKQNEELSSCLSEKDTEIKELKATVKKLRLELSQSKESDAIKSLKEENLSVLRSNCKLEKAYNSLVAKYNSLKERFKSSTDAVILERDELELVEVDTNLTYLFLCDTNRVNTTQAILKIFPNAVFSDKHDCIKGRKADMVIVLTSMIDHSSYGSVKEDAKNAGIPILHCENTNPEMIRETIWQYLNRN